MDNNYEQEFIKKVKTTNQPTPPNRRTQSSAEAKPSLALIVAIILAITVLVESVALIVFAVNYGEVLDLYGDTGIEYPEEPTSDSPEELSSDSDFDYDDDLNITAFNLTCTNEDDSQYVFTKSGTYQKSNSASNAIDSGTYSIINSGAIVLDSANQSEDKIVYYDGYDIIEGTSFYTCDDE